MTQDAPPATDWAALDQRAWDIIRGWPEAAGFSPVHEGVDYALLSRWYLWDRVARAIRREHSPEAYAFERRLLDEEIAADALMKRKKQRGSLRKSRLARTLALPLRLTGRVSTSSLFDNRGPGGIYLPLPNPRVNAIAQYLAHAFGISVWAGPHAIEAPEGIPRIPVLRAKAPDRAFTKRLHEAILAGLVAQGIQLEAADAASLLDCLDGQARHIPIAAAELDALQPKALLVHADNHPRPIHYVLLARQRGIPVFMPQHGLDCEHHYLDDAYATHIATWGPARAERYRRDSAEAPALSITGNPAWDAFRPPASIAREGTNWLWVTRPHTPAKCYAPSRQCGEGLVMLEALLDALNHHPARKLVIKPHPYDYAGSYEAAIAARGMGARATISAAPLADALRDARIVITEDSTAGLEAMLFGKPLVHAHFAPSTPSAAFSAYEAALPAFNARGLAEAIARVEAFTSAECASMLVHQRRYLDDFAGPLDGNSLARTAGALRALVVDA